MISIGECHCDLHKVLSTPRLNTKHALITGGVIGTGLFLGSAVGDRNNPAVPRGSLNLPYFTGCVVERGSCRRLPRIRSGRHCRVLPLRLRGGDDCLLVSRRTPVPLRPPNNYPRPNVGGVVGLADLYVDPALGFSLGWAAWVCIIVFFRVYSLIFQIVQLERHSAQVFLRDCSYR